jgi:hypothetical protein
VQWTTPPRRRPTRLQTPFVMSTEDSPPGTFRGGELTPSHARSALFHTIRAQAHQVQLGKITSLVIVGSACPPVEVAVDLSRAAISGFGVVGTVTGLSRNGNDTCR